MPNCLRTVLWTNENFHMYEYCSLSSTDGEGTRLDGVVVTAEEGKPLRAAYQIICDGQGLTRAVTVDAAGGLGDHHIRLEVDARGLWRWNGRDLPDCQGCLDVDLGFSPSTNSLPIRRLNLRQGERRDLTMAWVRFPEFDVVPFPQRYTRLDTNRYLFESLIDDFKAELLVDDQGIVRQYGDFWKAVAVSEAC